EGGGGDRSAPPHVYWRGMGGPYAKAGLVRRSSLPRADAAMSSAPLQAARRLWPVPLMDHSTAPPAPLARRWPTARWSGVVLGVALMVVSTARPAWSGEAPTAAVRQALDAILACERPEGGWTYVCNPSSGPYGAGTWPLVPAR